MSPRVMSSAAPIASVPNPACHFWKLPLELRFAVYDLAYGRDKTITPRALLGLAEPRREKPRDLLANMAARKSRRTAVNERLINKQYLAETMQHLAEVNRFCMKWMYGGLMHASWNVRHVSPDFLRHIRSLVVDWNATSRNRNQNIDLGKLCPRLRTLRILIGPASFSTAEWKDIRTQEDSDLSETTIVQAFSLVRGLGHFELEYGNPRAIHDCIKDYKYDWWDKVSTATIAAAESLKARLDGSLRELVTRPKSTASIKAVNQGSGLSRASRRLPRAAKKVVRY